MRNMFEGLSLDEINATLKEIDKLAVETLTRRADRSHFGSIKHIRTMEAIRQVKSRSLIDVKACWNAASKYGNNT